MIKLPISLCEPISELPSDKVPWPVRNVNISTFLHPVTQHPLDREKFDFWRALDSQILHFNCTQGLIYFFHRVGGGRVLPGWLNFI